MNNTLNFNIELELEPVMKVLCKNINCKNNLMWKELACCNLKHITISEKGTCEQDESKEKK